MAQEPRSRRCLFLHSCVGRTLTGLLEGIGHNLPPFAFHLLRFLLVFFEITSCTSGIESIFKDSPFSFLSLSLFYSLAHSSVLSFSFPASFWLQLEVRLSPALRRYRSRFLPVLAFGANRLLSAANPVIAESRCELLKKYFPSHTQIGWRDVDHCGRTFSRALSALLARHRSWKHLIFVFCDSVRRVLWCIVIDALVCETPRNSDVPWIRRCSII